MPGAWLIVALLAIYILYPWVKEKETVVEGSPTKLSIPKIADVEEKLLPTNEHLKAEAEKLKKKKALLKELEKDPELQSSIEDYLQPLVTASETLLADIHFNGRVIDQYGDPVAHHKIIYNTVGALYAEGSGPGETITDEEGLFIIDNARARTLYIEVGAKHGYQFPIPQYLDYNVFQKTTSDDPYIVNAWKIDRYPNIKKDRIRKAFVPDSRTYTLNFLDKTVSQEGNNLAGDLRVTFNADDHNWRVKIEAIDGGLQETSDLYRYLAPADGYENSLIYEGVEGNNRAQRISRNIFFTSRNNRVYGTIKMKIRPYHRDKSVINLDYVINLEQGRNLTVKK